MTDDFQHDFTKSEVREGIDLCLKKVRKLLKDAEYLIDNKVESAHALGLYTFALEEYGKALLLGDCCNKTGTNIKIPKWIFAKGEDYDLRKKSHDLKIDRASDELPDNKKMMVGVVRDKPATIDKPTVLRFRDGGGFTGHGSATGIFMTDNPANFEVRMKSFYVDWDEKTNQWNLELTAYEEYLKKAITQFRTKLDTTTSQTLCP